MIRRNPARATASASGVRRGDQAASTQWASAFMPVSADTRAGVARVSSGSWIVASGAEVGPPAPLLAPVRGSVIPKKGVSSAPEYVVGIEMWGSTGRSAKVAPGVPPSCSVKKAIALPASAHEPPPNDTMPSTPSRRDCSSAACTMGVGTCDDTSANVDASDRPSASITRRPSSLPARPGVVTSSTRRTPIDRTSSGSRASAPAPNTICWA